jgi:hypothetical protein
MGLVGSAHANVIYDVVVDYVGGYRYTFSMEFAAAPPPDKFETDLISSGPPADFINERFFSGIGSTPLEWAMQSDLPTVSLAFDGPLVPNGISFFSIDGFACPSPPGICTNGLRQTGARLEDPGEITVSASAVTVTERAAVVPEAPTLFLLALGLSILWWRTRSMQGRSLRQAIDAT